MSHPYLYADIPTNAARNPVAPKATYMTAAKPDMDQVSTVFCTILPDTLLHYYRSELYAFSYPCVISERIDTSI